MTISPQFVDNGVNEMMKISIDHKILSSVIGFEMKVAEPLDQDTVKCRQSSACCLLQTAFLLGLLCGLKGSGDVFLQNSG
jgi:hypothetical protein